MRRFLILLTVLIVSTTSCLSLKIKGKKSKPSKYVEEFFIDQGIMQYFIKPMKFKGEKEFFTVDFTFRDSISFDSYLTANYSVFTKNVVKKIDSAFVFVGDNKIKFCCSKRMFIDNYKKGYQIRYSSNITLNELSELVDNEKKIVLYYNGDEHYFLPVKKTKTACSVVKKNIIDIIILNRTE